MQFRLGQVEQPQYSGMKARLAQVLSLVRFGYQYGFVPYVIYLGLKKGADAGMPELTLRSILW